MTQTRTYTRSFAGGEVTPELFGNVELVKIQTGVRTSKNFQTLPYGPAAFRPGFKFIQRVKGSATATRLVPFNYNTEQTYILEFGDQYIRFHTAGATLLSSSGLTITGITKANPGVLTYTGTDPANGDWQYLAAIGGMTQLNGRYVIVANVNTGANTFELTDLFGNNIDTSGFTTYTSGGTATAPYQVASPYVAADLFDLHYVQSADVLSITHPGYAPRELSRVSAASWTLGTITFSPTIAAPTGVVATPAVGGGITYYYQVTAISSDGLEESLASSTASAASAALSATNTIAVTFNAVTDAIRYNVYRKDNGVFGYIGQTAELTFTDDNITPDLTITPPNANTPFGSSNNYPAAVSYAEQRRIFAGTNNRRQTTWMTRSGTESNLSYSIPTRDDDSITFRIAARENNAIKHVVPLGDPILLTAGGIWRISAANGDALTPASITAKPQAYVGVNNVQPAATPASVLSVQAEGSHVQEIVYSVDDAGGQKQYKVTDVSIMAPHLFDNYEIVDMAYAHAPDRTCWCVRSDGVLLGLTYVPEHEVLAWHQHTTDGLFESVAVTVEDNRNVLYAVIQRTINSQTVRYVERLAPRIFADLEDAFHVDSGLTYSGAAATAISGLHHLEGETVSVLADGGVHPQVEVSAGAVTLEHAAALVHIGLAIPDAYVHLLPAVLQGEAHGQGRPKNINQAWLRVSRASGLSAGPTLDDMIEFPPRTDEPYGSPPTLKTEELDLVTLPGWSDDGALFIQQTSPLPATLVALTMEIEVGG